MGNSHFLRPTAIKKMKQIKFFLKIALINTLVGIILLETLLVVLSYTSSSLLLSSKTGDLESEIIRKKLTPQKTGFGLRVNSLGYYDKEFTGNCDIAVVGDSFVVGIVPFTHRFTSVLEKELKKSVYSFGISSTSLPHYRWIIQNDVSKFSADIVLLCVFIGNDIHELAPPTEGWYSPQILVVFNRLFSLIQNQVSGGYAYTQYNGTPPYLFRPELESPTLSKEYFLNLERARSTVCEEDKLSGLWDLFFENLKKIHQDLSERLIVVLIPDEFQINDELFRSIGSPGRRDFPQERIIKFCQTKKIQHIDLLPILRDESQKQRLYHLQDTHWNANGNLVAGQYIAKQISGNPMLAD